MINNHLCLTQFSNPIAAIPNQKDNAYGLFEKDLIEVLSADLNFTYSLCNPTDVQQMGFPLPNGSWTGLIGKLMRKEADMSLEISTITLSKYQVVDMSFPVMTDNVAIMIPYPELVNNLSLNIDTSTIIALISFFAATFLVAGLLWLVHRIGKYGELKWNEIANIMIRLCFIQAGGVRVKSSVFRLMFGSWLVALFFIINIYYGTLTSMMTTTTYKYLATSIEDVVENENIKPLMIRGSAAYGDVVASPLKIFQQLAKRFQENPNLLVNTYEYVEFLLKQPNQVFILSDFVQAFDIGHDLKKTGKCRALILDKIISSRNNCILLQKNSPYTASLNREALLLSQSGILQYIDKKYKTSSSRCSMRELKSEGSQQTAIKLSQFWGIFLILIGGHLLGFIWFLCELLYFNYQRRRERRRR